MADHTDTFIREVDEEMRRERLARVWQQYGLYFIVAAALLVVGVAGYKYMEYRRISTSETMGARYDAAAQLAANGKTDEAQKAFEGLAADAPAGYSGLARLRVAGALAKAGKSADAVAAYEALAKDGSADELLRDFASLQAAMLRLDTADWTEMQNRLNDLMNDRNPWRASARELFGLAAYKAGRMDDARKTFEQLLGDRAAPPAMVERIQIMLSMIADAERSAPKASPESNQPATTKPAPAKQ
jgi:hypothetical protein